jgi:chromosome partitioning protein
MPVIVVANPKGGVGKSTLSTNLAGWLARQGHAVMLGDTDRQQSARAWLGLRPAAAPAIQTWDIAHDHVVRPPKGVTHVVLDTPAGLHGKRLDEIMKLADQVLVPLQASIFDIYATRDFIAALLERKKHARVPVAVVGNRVREHTIAADQLQAFVGQLGVPVLGHLRDTQNYVHLAARGLTLWDVAPGRVERDLAQWEPITRWVDNVENAA